MTETFSCACRLLLTVDSKSRRRDLATATLEPALEPSLELTALAPVLTLAVAPVLRLPPILLGLRVVLRATLAVASHVLCCPCHQRGVGLLIGGKLANPSYAGHITIYGR